ncbi:hypothetical protein COO60DRAFT_1207072 [Scenedesmus sp. NREL 46B-D3]|nr:hypothetical protein COO60DRAFT_1207072 [Scenedesmus sp. NREL 46B-D3]
MAPISPAACTRSMALLAFLLVMAVLANAAPIRPAFHRLGTGTGALTCDGTLRTLDMPNGPYPTGEPWNPPFNNQAGFTCARSAIVQDCNASSTSFTNAVAAGKCCGAEGNVTCGKYFFNSVTTSSGDKRGIISPVAPIIFRLTAGNAFLTFVEWTAIDVGTAGAKLVGGYTNDVITPKTIVHTWTPNGPFQDNLGPNGSPITTFGPCSSCEVDKGITNMSVTAQEGAGFTRIELSQAFTNTACSGAGAPGVNHDGMLWSGMKYKCVSRTCGDINLHKEGFQRFNCSKNPGPMSYVYNPAAAANTTLSKESCCLPITCGDTDPLTPEKNVYDCAAKAGPGFQTKAGTENLAANNTNCCEFVPTCLVPTEGATTRFNCSTGFEYNTTKDNSTNVSNAGCCFVPIPPCTPNQCPAPDNVAERLSDGFEITPVSNLVVNVTYTNTAFLKCNCEQKISWLTIATCGSTSSSMVNCAKITDVKLGDQVTLSNVACDAVIDVVIHDGSCKKFSSQAPSNVVLAGCTVGTKLPFNCRSNDADGACGGKSVYSYTVECTPSGRHLLRRLHF